MTKKKTKASPKTSASLELEGAVFITETNNKTGKVISREEIDGTVVLRALLVVIEDALKASEKEANK